MNREQIEQLWNDKSNWTAGLIYHCPRDPRAIVPRRWRWGGWTLNFSHPRAAVAGVAAMALAVGPALIVMYLFNDRTAFLGAMALSIVALIAWSHFEATRTG
jgi:uncharacterized membrane protein